MAASFNSYKDPYWADLATKAATKVGASPRLLVSIIQNGERSNRNQVSEAGARTVFQITPTTRKLILDKYGVDPYLSDENAAEAAALLLKESSQRNKGNEYAIAGEYHGGTDRANWGPKTNAYIQRVVGGVEKARSTDMGRDLDAWLAGQPTTTDTQIEQVRQLGQDIESSRTPAAEAKVPEAAKPDTSAMLADFDQWQASQPAQQAAPEDLGFFGDIKETVTGLPGRIREAVTGEQRATEYTKTLPEWTSMPELNELSAASAKTGLGTMFAAPDEIVQIIKANYPNTKIRQDEKGNYIISSSIDGADYVIPPGLTVGDIPRVIGGLLAFTPAGKATSIAGSALASASTQAAIEASQAATGGDFSAKDVALTGAVGGLVPPVMQSVKAVGNAIASPIKAALSRTAGEAAPIVEAAAPVAAPVAQAVPVAAPTVAETAQTATRAAEGLTGRQAATQELAAAVAPDAKTVAAADRLGITEYLQPDHVSTNQAFRDIAQAAKSSVGSEGRAAELQGLQKVAEKADDVITKLGGSEDVSTLSSNIKKNLQATQAELDSKSEALYTKINTSIPATEVVAPTRTLGYLNAQIKDLGGAQHLSPLEKKVWTNLKANPTYALTDKTRKLVGSATQGKGVFKDAETGEARNIYRLITEDQKVVADKFGMADTWEAAKSAIELRKGIEDDLASLFGRNIDASMVGDLSKSISALPKGDTSKFINLVKAVPEDMRQELVASGLNTAFRKQGVVNFNTYANWYEGLLKNKQAYAALMTNLPPSARKSLSDLYRVSSGIANASKERIPTGRLQTAEAAFLGGETLAGKVYEAAKHNVVAAGTAAALSAVSPGLGAAIGAALARGAKTPAIIAVDKLLASPAFKEAVLAAAKGQAKPAAHKLAKSVVFVDFVKKAKLTDLKDMNARERWILQPLEAGQQQFNSR